MSSRPRLLVPLRLQIDPCPRCGGKVKYAGGVDEKHDKYFIHAACVDCHQITEGLEVEKRVFDKMTEIQDPEVFNVLMEVKDRWDKGIYDEDEDMYEAVKEAHEEEHVFLTALKHMKRLRDRCDAPVKSPLSAKHEFDLLKACPDCGKEADYNLLINGDTDKKCLEISVQVKCTNCNRIAEAPLFMGGRPEVIDEVGLAIVKANFKNRAAAKLLGKAARSWNEDKLVKELSGKVLMENLIEYRQLLLDHAEAAVKELKEYFKKGKNNSSEIVK